MPNIIKITEYGAPELDPYVRLTGAQLRNRLDPSRGIFIAESPTVIEVAMNAGCTPVSLLTDARLVNDGVSDIISRISALPSEDPAGIPIYTAERDTLTRITGFELTRGALCAMRRPTPKSAEEILDGGGRVAIFEGICDATNIGALFRSAAAMNIDGVLITPTCCDPLNRRAVRVSMGTVFQIPWAQIGESACDWPERGLRILRSAGYKTAAMALSDDSVSIDDPALAAEERLAIILGTEGDGLSRATIAKSDYTVKIPMSHGVDSLNVAAAGAIAFWQLSRRRPR